MKITNLIDWQNVGYWAGWILAGICIGLMALYVGSFVAQIFIE